MAASRQFEQRKGQNASPPIRRKGEKGTACRSGEGGQDALGKHSLEQGKKPENWPEKAFTRVLGKEGIDISPYSP